MERDEKRRASIPSAVCKRGETKSQPKIAWPRRGSAILADFFVARRAHSSSYACSSRLEFGAGLRPAFPDNLPRIRIDNNRISVNGLYRHGFLIAPALAELTLAYVEHGRIDNEVMQCA